METLALENMRPLLLATARLEAIRADRTAVLAMALAFRGRLCSARAVMIRATKRTAQAGDRVDVHLIARTSEGGYEVENTREAGKTVALDLSATDEEEGPQPGEEDLPLIKAAKAAVRGLAEGEAKTIPAEGPQRRSELVFHIPSDHPEMARLAEEQLGRAPEEGDVVTLANGRTAAILGNDGSRCTLDANNPLAGSKLIVDVELESIQGAAGTGSGGG